MFEGKARDYPFETLFWSYTLG